MILSSKGNKDGKSLQVKLKYEGSADNQMWPLNLTYY